MMRAPRASMERASVPERSMGTWLKFKAAVSQPGKHV